MLYGQRLQLEGEMGGVMHKQSGEVTSFSVLTVLYRSDMLNELKKERQKQNPSGWKDALCRNTLKQMLEVS